MNLKQRQKLFENPTMAYRGKTFWSWNGKLEKDELIRQLDVINDMGFGGYYIHARTGLATEYLGEEWFAYVNQCIENGYKKGMETWIYDEDKWPSGFAGGLVTQEEKYRAMYMEMILLNESELQNIIWDDKIAGVFACRMADGIFDSKRQLKNGDDLEAGETAVLIYLRYSACSDNYNESCYVNTMDKESIERYIEVTHEKYLEKCGDKFAKEILGFFTDEPHRGGAFIDFAEGKVNACPYTPGMFEEFENRFGYSLRGNLPELFLRKKKGELSKVTRDYFELCQELFLENYAKPLDKWCRDNKLIFTGHVLHEDFLSSQAIMQGSLMRFYEYMEYPGIDLLGEHEKCYWIAKQISSVARQLDKEWVLVELYGGIGWQANFESYKNVGDWLALFGTNIRCHHLSWYTMKGETKRDWPGSMFHQSSWYTDYHYIEDYFSRIHTALHGGIPECGLLVINPIESVWARAYSGAFAGILRAEDDEIKRLEEQYEKVFHILADHQIDFDYGEEDIMSRHGRVEKGILHIGKASYSKVLVAGVDTMRKTTLALLDKFIKQGGIVIFAGDIPSYVDVELSNEVHELAEKCVVLPFDEDTVAEACRCGKEVLIESDGSGNIFVQKFQIDGGHVIMLLNVDRKKGYENVKISIGEAKCLELWDARSGKVVKPEYQVSEMGITITIDLEAGGERLIVISDTERELPKESIFDGTKEIELPDAFSYTLTEKNICVLDMVTVKGGEQILSERQEVLKADKVLRDVFGIPYRSGEMLQPWYEIKHYGEDGKLLGKVELEYSIEISVLPSSVELVVEDLKHITCVSVNGMAISTDSIGKWIDICFDKIIIPDYVWKKGHNTVTVTMDFYKSCGLESVYLLGDFGVSFNVINPVLTALPEKLLVGDITHQGLPFYSGSVVYHIEGMEGKKVCVTAKNFGGSLVKLIGEEDVVIAFPPFQASVENLKAIQVILTRRNTFGPLHQVSKFASVYTPESFMTEGKDWEDSYMLYEQGLLEKPIVKY